MAWNQHGDHDMFADRLDYRRCIATEAAFTLRGCACRWSHLGLRYTDVCVTGNRIDFRVSDLVFDCHDSRCLGCRVRAPIVLFWSSDRACLLSDESPGVQISDIA